MEMRRVQGFFNWVIIASETSHVFCCVLPTVFSVISMMMGVGMVSSMPGWMESLHGIMHEWEIPMIAFSGGVVLIGWALYYVSKRMDCHDTGCTHGPCGPKKKTTATILKIATVLFVVNVSIYLVFHRGAETLGLYHDPHEAHAAHLQEEE